MLLSLVLYLHGLGFYSDYWGWLAQLGFSSDQSIAGYFRVGNTPDRAMRPVEVLHFSILYWLFGIQPLGYHLVNSVTHVAFVVLFYLVLRATGVPRLVALSVPAVYGLLPHYSTDRFWSFAYNFSMVLYFTSLYCDLRFLPASGTRRLRWRLLGVASLFASTLGNETILPLFILNPAIVWLRQQRLGGLAQPDGVVGNVPRFLFLTNVRALVSVIAFKARTTTRLGNDPFIERTAAILKRAVAVDSDSPYGFNIWKALERDYGTLGLGLPRVAWNLLNDYPSLEIIAAAMLVGILTFGYLYRVASRDECANLPRKQWLILLGAGFIIFGFGYSIFLTYRNFIFTLSGQNNRSSIAAAIGVALSLVGMVGWLSTLLPSVRWRSGVFSLLITVICCAGFVTVDTLGSLWVAAARQQELVLADIRERLPTLPDGTTLLLDGVCSYVGPALVFETQWDLEGAIQHLYHNPTLRADVVTERLAVEEQGIVSETYGFAESHVYGNLIVYNYSRGISQQLHDATTARQYFESFNPDRRSGCPHGEPGMGVEVLR
jgi:hypothetical protein